MPPLQATHALLAHRPALITTHHIAVPATSGADGVVDFATFDRIAAPPTWCRHYLSERALYSESPAAYLTSPGVGSPPSDGVTDEPRSGATAE